MSGSATRKEAKVFWEMVQYKNLSKLPTRAIKPGTSCGSCGHYKSYHCALKRKLVKPYNVCNEWKAK